MNIQNLPSSSVYGPRQQDDYDDQSYRSGGDVTSPEKNVTSPGKNRAIQFESDSAHVNQHSSGQHIHGADGLQNSKVIDYSNASPTNQSNIESNTSEISPSLDFSLGDQMQALIDILQNVMDLLAGMLGTNQAASNNESGSYASDANAFSSSGPQETIAGQTNSITSNEPTGVSSSVSSPSASSLGSANGVERTPTISDFKTIDPGEGPDLIKDENGKFVFNEVVDDSFLPEDVQQGMREAVEANKDLSFFQDNFNNESDMYQYLVHMANLESGGGASLENEHDAAGSGTGGSAGYMHLHMNYGLAENSFGGAPLNTEGWSQEEVLGDYSKYTELTMKHIDGAYQSVGGSSNNEATEQAMALWWTGNDSAAAGAYYMEALSGGTGVNHNTGSAYM